MGGIFGGKPDDSALREQQKQLAEQEKKLERQRLQQAASQKARAARSSGANSLLSGLETGVGEGKREQLG